MPCAPRMMSLPPVWHANITAIPEGTSALQRTCISTSIRWTSLTHTVSWRTTCVRTRPQTHDLHPAACCCTPQHFSRSACQHTCFQSRWPPGLNSSSRSFLSSAYRVKAEDAKKNARSVAPHRRLDPRVAAPTNTAASAPVQPPSNIKQHWTRRELQSAPAVSTVVLLVMQVYAVIPTRGVE